MVELNIKVTRLVVQNGKCCGCGMWREKNGTKQNIYEMNTKNVS
jgi:hypothetical protein